MSPNNLKWFILTIIAAIVGVLFGPVLFRSMGSMGGIVGIAIFVAIIGYIVYLLAANKVGKAADPAMVKDARSLVPAPGTARIYVVRRGFMGGMAGMKVDIAGVASGQIRMNQFVMAEVSPGTYIVETAMARNGMKPSNSESSLTLDEGETVVLKATLEVRATHAITVQKRLSPGEARSEIASAKMVQWTS
ncbi:hypothetical protein G4G27_11910 [Sphingomonas sp. So64.6b]|uniref:hypothetical protein n=1 Tax=Sphingomonas sp. So64.6b TaxID=2997354 RepID=UPI0015FEF7DD|nr:hypothetical protein [Sphingomonas sp. So64.6b]QNA84611.1 hypothetical protein G4G27_11910 [Sphingomonas sp. So64.6b]